MIAAGSLVLKPVPARTTVAGAPARVVGTQTRENPSRDVRDTTRETGRDQRTGEVCVPEEEEGKEGLGGEGGGVGGR